MERVAGLLLAGGGGRRVGVPKALLRLDGRLLVERAVGLLRDAGCAPIVVVLGAGADRVRAEADLGDAIVVVNEAWATGLGGSLRAGLDAVTATPAEATVVMLVDTPGVSAEAVRRVAALPYREALVCATYGGRRGHPMLFGRAHWSGIATLAKVDVGARPYLVARGAEVLDVACDGVGDDADIDTPDAAAAWGIPVPGASGAAGSGAAGVVAPPVSTPASSVSSATTEVIQAVRDAVPGPPPPSGPPPPRAAVPPLASGATAPPPLGPAPFASALSGPALSGPALSGAAPSGAAPSGAAPLAPAPLAPAPSARVPAPPAPVSPGPVSGAPSGTPPGAPTWPAPDQAVGQPVGQPSPGAPRGVELAPRIAALGPPFTPPTRTGPPVAPLVARVRPETADPGRQSGGSLPEAPPGTASAPPARQATARQAGTPGTDSADPHEPAWATAHAAGLTSPADQDRP
jgi:CTP:molybdopterin cytidylyltransferase MocA